MCWKCNRRSGQPKLKSFVATFTEGSGRYRWEGQREVWASSDVQARRKAGDYASNHGLKVHRVTRKKW